MDMLRRLINCRIIIIINFSKHIPNVTLLPFENLTVIRRPSAAVETAATIDSKGTANKLQVATSTATLSMVTNQETVQG